MKKKTQYILIVLVAVISVFAVLFFIDRSKPENEQSIIPPTPSAKLQLCPDEWVDNQMPGDFSDKFQRQYFILNGERRELEEFDVEWVQKNCNLEKHVIW